MAIPVIYKGDDTDFRGSTGFTLKVVISSNLNLSGCTVEVEVLGFRRSFPASATGELLCPFAFTAAETQRMPLGIHAATVRVYDAKGRVRTINNSIRVKVTNVLSEAYGKDDPQEVTLAISTVDLEAYAKKEEVTAAITAAMKDASASVKLHVLTPEVTDATVTLKPQDGKANWVEGTVAFAPKIEKTFHSHMLWRVTYYNGSLDAGMHFYSEDLEFTHENSEITFIEIDDYSYTYLVGIKTKEDIVLTMNCEGGDGYYAEDFDFRFPAGTEFEIFLVGPPDVTDGSWRPGDPVGDFSFSGEIMDATCPAFNIQDVLPSSMVDMDDGHMFELDSWGASTGIVEQLVYRKDATAVTRLPDSIGFARQFSLSLATDVTAETAVTWEGADEIIEAFPGASKLVPGLTVWDVAEVAPGKFRVDRASNPAQSVPLTLTAPNGRVAELTVGDDLVLEVKEK